MKTISFDLLREELLDASFMLTDHMEECVELHHYFAHEFNGRTIERAWEGLDRCRRFITRIKDKHTDPIEVKYIRQLSRIITDSFCRIAVEMSNGGTTCSRPLLGSQGNTSKNINDEFLF